MGKVDFLGLHHPPPQTIGSRVAFSLFLFSRARIPHGGKNLPYSPPRKPPPAETLEYLYFSFYFKPFGIYLWVLDGWQVGYMGSAAK